LRSTFGACAVWNSPFRKGDRPYHIDLRQSESRYGVVLRSIFPYTCPRYQRRPSPLVRHFQSVFPNLLPSKRHASPFPHHRRSPLSLRDSLFFLRSFLRHPRFSAILRIRGQWEPPPSSWSLLR